MKLGNRIIILFSIALISLAMHYPHLSKDLMSIHVWRQTQTQSTINNFFEEDFNILNPKINDRGDGDGIYRMEFPLMQWLTAGIFKIFGKHLILCRIFMFIIGLFSVYGIYNLLFEIFQKYTLAIIGAWAFNFSPAFYYYTINPIPDNLALCFSIWGIVFFLNWKRSKRMFVLFLSGLLLSVGALCKLPFILYFTVPIAYLISEMCNNGINKKISLRALLISVFIFLPLIWYLKVIPQWHDNGIVSGILDNKFSFSETLFFLKFNLISTLPELLLNYGSVLFFLAGFYFLIRNKSYKDAMFPVFVLWSLTILSYFFFEINMIGKVHDYYLFPFYPALFILVSYGAYNLLNPKNGISKYLTLFLLLILPLTAYLRMQTRWNVESPGFNKDLLIYKDDLQQAVPKNALCLVGNDNSHSIFFYYIDKKGWVFNNDNLNSENMKEMIGRGARYFYSDSREVESYKDIAELLDKLILEKGSVRVYSLKKN